MHVFDRHRARAVRGRVRCERREKGGGKRPQIGWHRARRCRRRVEGSVGTEKFRPAPREPHVENSPHRTHIRAEREGLREVQEALVARILDTRSEDCHLIVFEVNEDAVLIEMVVPDTLAAGLLEGCRHATSDRAGGFRA